MDIKALKLCSLCRDRIVNYIISQMLARGKYEKSPETDKG